MSKSLIVEDVSGLFPVTCTCQCCKRKMKVTELSDFQIEKLSSFDIPPEPPVKTLVTKCIACTEDDNWSFPPENISKKLMAAFEVMTKGFKPTVETKDQKTSKSEGELEISLPVGAEPITGVLLKKPINLVCGDGDCHFMFKLTTLDGIFWSETDEKFYVKCGKCGLKVKINNREATAMLGEQFLSFD